MRLSFIASILDTCLKRGRPLVSVRKINKPYGDDVHTLQIIEVDFGILEQEDLFLFGFLFFGEIDPKVQFISALAENEALFLNIQM